MLAYSAAVSRSNHAIIVLVASIDRTKFSCLIFSPILPCHSNGSLCQVKMLIIHRWFDISAAERDLKYKPIVTFEDGFAKTLAWLKEDWLPEHKAKHG